MRLDLALEMLHDRAQRHYYQLAQSAQRRTLHDTSQFHSKIQIRLRSAELAQFVEDLYEPGCALPAWSALPARLMREEMQQGTCHIHYAVAVVDYEERAGSQG